MSDINSGIRGVLCCFLVAGMSASTFGQTWIGTASTNWSVGASWSGGTPSSSNTTNLTFRNLGSTAITATNDLGPNFLINTMTFDNDGTADFTVASKVGSSIRFGGNSNLISSTGGFSSTIASDVSSNGTLKIRASPGAYGSLTMSGIISDGTSAASLLIDRPNANWFGATPAGTVTLSGANTFTGGVTLASGNLNIANSSALGTGTLAINGGTIGGFGTIGNNVVVNGGIRSLDGTLTYSGFVSGNGGFTGYGNSGARFEAFSTLSGNVEVGVTSNNWSSPFVESTPGKITLRNNGRLLGIDQFTIRNGGSLLLDNFNVALGNRVADDAAINLTNGIFEVVTSSIVEETVGAVTGRGSNAIYVGSQNSDSTLNLASINRADRGTFMIRGKNLGLTSTTGAGEGRVFSASAPAMVGGGGAAGSSQVSIVPWAIGQDSSNPATNTLLTYDGTVGFRLLDETTEYVSSLATSTVADNVKISGGLATNNGIANANALVLDQGIAGSGQINVNSGTVLSATSYTSCSNGLNFGNAEGHIFINSSFTMTGALTGTNGLTISGRENDDFGNDRSATLNLRSNNTGLTGTLTLNSALANFSNDSNLPGSGPIQVSSRRTTYPEFAASGGFVVSGNSNPTITRDVRVLDGMALIDLGPGSGRLIDWQGTISGEGGLMIDSGGDISTMNSIRLSDNNTYSGPTQILGGKVRITSDAAFGNSQSVHLGGGIFLEGNWTTSRRITGGVGRIETGSFNATFNGEFVGDFGAITKLGVGALTINDNIPVPSRTSIRVHEGSVYLNSIGTNLNITDSSGTGTGIQGVFGGTGRAGDVLLARTGIIRPGIESGSIDDLEMASLLWNPGARLNFDMASPGINDQLNIYGAFTKGTAGTGSGYSFNFDELGISLGTYTLINFATTNFTAGDFSAIWSNPNITGTFVLNSNNLQYQITAIPEPTGLLVLMASSLIAIQRRRRTGK